MNWLLYLCNTIFRTLGKFSNYFLSGFVTCFLHKKVKELSIKPAPLIIE